MKRKIVETLLLGFLTLGVFGTATAEDVYVKNRVFEGAVIGRGLSSEVELNQLAEAVGLEVTRLNGKWKLGEMVLPGRTAAGKVFVSVSDLKDAGFQVIHLPRVGTLDISPPRAQSTAQTGEIDNRKLTLVYFGADW